MRRALRCHWRRSGVGALRIIVKLQLAEVVQRIEDKGLSIKVEESALHFLIKKGFHEDYGARPMRRAIERHIEDPLAEKLLRAEFEELRPIVVSCEGDPTTAEELTFEEGEAPEQAEVETAGAAPEA